MKNTTPETENLYPKLLASLDHPEVLLAATEVGEELGCSIYLVGGPVRDFFLGRRLKDLDLVVEEKADAAAKALARKLSGRIKSHSPFGTFKIVYSGGEVDLAMARRETYPAPAALPRVEPASIDEDLHRRDFTANAMAVALSGPRRGRLLDPFSGLADLREGVLRVLHLDSFVDDPTRIFRAGRYAVRFGWALAEETLQALGRAYRTQAPLRLSPARILGEIKRILEEPDPENVLRCLEIMGLWLALELPPPPEHFSSLWPILRRNLPTRTLLKGMIIALAHGESHLLLRLGLQPGEAERYSRSWEELCRHSPELTRASSPSRRYRLLETYPPEIICAYFLHYKELEYIAKEYFKLKNISLEISGKDLKRELGLTPGPLLGRILREVFYARLDGRVKNREDELRLARELLAREG